MKATIELELEPFGTPNFVRQSVNPDIGRDTAAIPLSALDPLTLDRLCREFREDVFKKAGKSQPPQQAHYCYKCRDLL